VDEAVTDSPPATVTSKPEPRLAVRNLLDPGSVQKRLALALTVIWLLAVPAAGAGIEGGYVLDRGRSDDVKGAIERVVKGMNPVTRSIARRRLARTNPAYERVSIRFEGNSARVSAGPSTLTLPLSGEPVRWNRDGEVIRVSGRRDAAGYVETFDARDGRRVNRFTPAGEGLLLTVTVTSPRLPRPLEYRLHYRRSG
jgi:hypothetical protein